MTREIEEIQVLKEYLVGVMDRADHHAPNVDEICLAIIGGIIWKKDNHTLKVLEKDGEMKNVLWVQIGGVRYAFSYNHEEAVVEMRSGNIQGDVLHSFTNETPISVIKTIFESL